MRRILDLGASAGATTTAFKRAWPDAEVHGIDISAPMLRYAHLRAVEQDIEVHFKQMRAEEMRYPDGHFDVVFALLFFHEVPVPIARRVIAEAYRVLRPGGTFTVLDFSGDRGRDVYSMFFAEMDAADNGEPFLPGYVRSNIEDLMSSAGLVMRPYNAMDPGATLRTGGQRRTSPRSRRVLARATISPSSDTVRTTGESAAANNASTATSTMRSIGRRTGVSS